MTSADAVPVAVITPEPPPSAITIAYVVYALHGLSLGIGAFGAASVVGAFLFGWPSLIAVVLNYMKRGDARGTWLESHFRWQIRTFWLALVYAAGIALASAILAVVLVGFAIWFIGLFLLGIWACVRILRGFLRLRDRQPI
jgi:uncharacterized membrane protein